MRNDVCLLVLAFTLAFGENSLSQTHKKATPPTVGELVGAWIGLEDGGSEFTRVELFADGSGYLALVGPSDSITNEYGVQLYKIKKWSIDGWHVACDLSPVSSNAEPASASGELFVSSIRLEIHGVKRRWKIESKVYLQSRVDAANKETQNAISAVENKQ